VEHVFDHHRGVDGAPADEAERLDRQLGDTDWSAPAEGSVRSTFAAPSGPLAVVSLGPAGGTAAGGERVVLVPGVTGSKEDFVLMLPILAAAGYLVQSFDLAGQYESAAAGPAPGARYDERLFVDDLVAFLEGTAGGAPAHLLGYSFAGTIAQRVLVERPELVRSLALLAAPPVPGDAFGAVRILGPFSRFAPSRVVAALMIWGVRNNLNHAPEHRVELVRRRFELTRRDSVADVMRLMRRTPDLAAEIAGSPVPRLVAVGTHDLWPTEAHRAFAERIGAELCVYATGHSPCETTPHQLSRDLLRLYARADGPPSAGVPRAAATARPPASARRGSSRPTPPAEPGR